jgi:hypothetical protein
MSEKEKADAVFNGDEKSPGAQRRLVWLFAGLAALAVLLVYLPSLNNRFVNWDDPKFIQNNFYIRYLNLSSLQWMFTTFHQGNWTPLTWLSFCADYRLGGWSYWDYQGSSLPSL